MSQNTNALSQTYGTYLSVEDDVVPWLRAGSGAVIGRDQLVNLQLITDASCEWVQNYLQRPVGPKTYDRRFDGGAGLNGAYIMLPFYPVLSVTSVIEYRGTSGAYTLAESTPTVQVDGWQCSYSTGRLNRVFPGNVQKLWFPGSRNIEVVWVAGFNPVPAPIKMATLELIAHWYRNTQQISGRFAGAVVASSEYEPADNASMLWAGVPYRVESMLKPYISYGMG